MGPGTALDMAAPEDGFVHPLRGRWGTTSNAVSPGQRPQQPIWADTTPRAHSSPRVWAPNPCLAHLPALFKPPRQAEPALRHVSSLLWPNPAPLGGGWSCQRQASCFRICHGSRKWSLASEGESCPEGLLPSASRSGIAPDTAGPLRAFEAHFSADPPTLCPDFP